MGNYLFGQNTEKLAYKLDYSPNELIKEMLPIKTDLYSALSSEKKMFRKVKGCIDFISLIPELHYSTWKFSTRDISSLRLDTSPQPTWSIENVNVSEKTILVEYLIKYDVKVDSHPQKHYGFFLMDKKCNFLLNVSFKTENMDLILHNDEYIVLEFMETQKETFDLFIMDLTSMECKILNLEHSSRRLPRVYWRNHLIYCLNNGETWFINLKSLESSVSSIIGLDQTSDLCVIESILSILHHGQGNSRISLYNLKTRQVIKVAEYDRYFVSLCADSKWGHGSFYTHDQQNCSVCIINQDDLVQSVEIKDIWKDNLERSYAHGNVYQYIGQVCGYMFGSFESDRDQIMDCVLVKDGTVFQMYRETEEMETERDPEDLPKKSLYFSLSVSRCIIYSIKSVKTFVVFGSDKKYTFEDQRMGNLSNLTWCFK